MRSLVFGFLVWVLLIENGIEVVVWEVKFESRIGVISVRKVFLFSVV